MTRLTYVTPISYKKIENLHFTDYIFLYLDGNNKLKRAIPDFNEEFMSSDDSKINEALYSDRITPFRILSDGKNFTNITFCIFTEDNGEISKYNGVSGNKVKLENLLLDSKRRETVSKLLKKRN